MNKAIKKIRGNSRVINSKKIKICSRKCVNQIPCPYRFLFGQTENQTYTQTDIQINIETRSACERHVDLKKMIWSRGWCKSNFHVVCHLVSGWDTNKQTHVRANTWYVLKAFAVTVAARLQGQGTIVVPNYFPMKVFVWKFDKIFLIFTFHCV